MNVHWALPMFQSVLPDDVWAGHSAALADPFLDFVMDYMPLFNGQTGELIKKIPTPKVIRFSRRKLRAYLSKGIDIEVRSRK